VRRSRFALAALALLLAPAAARAGVGAGPALDGPSAGIVALAGVAIARDDTGGVAYLKSVGGVEHAFVSLVDGGFGAPLQLDGGLANPTSALEIAAGDGGRLAAVFINGGGLYAAVKPAGSATFSTPQLIAASAQSPAVGMSITGTAYAAFVTGGPAPHLVQVARLDPAGTAFTSFPQSLNLNPDDDAGATAATAPRIAVATDGSAIVTWGESMPDGFTHVVMRRAGSAGVGPDAQDLTLPSLGGQPGGSADAPAPATEDAIDFGWVGFRQSFGGVSRVIVRQQLGGQVGLPQAVDGLSLPTADGADDPSLALDAKGDGLSLAELTGSHAVMAGTIQASAPTSVSVTRVQTTPDAIAPQPALALGYDDYGAVAWLQSAGAADPTSVHARPYVSGSFTAEGVMSNPQFGPVDPAGGIAGAADRRGEAIFAFVQQGPDGRRVVVGGALDPPTDFGVRGGRAFRNTVHPTLSWKPSSSAYGIASYNVLVDGVSVGTTARTSLLPAAAIAPGAHRLTIVATDRFGQSTNAPTVPLVIDTTPPRVRLVVHGSTLRVQASDPHGSGVASVRATFGDGASATAHGSLVHRYGHGGRFTVTVTVVDQAGNVTRVQRRVGVG
jgi:hypothetical protein